MKTCLTRTRHLFARSSSYSIDTRRRLLWRTVADSVGSAICGFQVALTTSAKSTQQATARFIILLASPEWRKLLHVFSSGLQYGGAKSFERTGFRDALSQRMAVAKAHPLRVTFANEARFGWINPPPTMVSSHPPCQVRRAGYDGTDLVLLALYVDALVPPPS